MENCNTEKFVIFEKKFKTSMLNLSGQVQGYIIKIHTKNVFFTKDRI